ncbi:hypothetical protein D9C73_005272 [Collichthys lucidus]|uniref:Uncharacterized protein n=1 Tax=Collichthys lucidus TaxID=240159 RepID=A0A4U5UA54_COLLU|nr:hypothetical protein D9C73_005272 [Collichthys lucidus]
MSLSSSSSSSSSSCFPFFNSTSSTLHHTHFSHRCLMVAGLPRTVLAAPAARQGRLPLLSCGVDKRLALFPVRRRAQTQTAMA